MKKLKEYWNFIYQKIVGEEASPEYVARGWAIGMFWGCVGPFGLQLLVSIPTAFILRGSKIGATVGTFITNHFTIFVIYPIQCYVGSKLIGAGLTYDVVKNAMVKVINEQSYEALLSCGTDLMWSFFAGGFLMAAVFVPITYFGVLRIAKRYNAAKK